MKVSPNSDLAAVRHKLQHAAHGEWSARVTPREALLLLLVLEDYLAVLNNEIRIVPKEDG